jgi:hypothetical protein
MLSDFQPVFTREKSLHDLANTYSHDDLCSGLNSYVDHTIQVIRNVSDEQATFVPPDPEADDPYAVNEEERHIGWSLIHLVMHVTASAEEAAAFSSILARGIAVGGRLRSERDWRQLTTCGDALARLEECRRMCLAYLAAWPDQPDLVTVRIMPENMSWMKPNAQVSFLFGLMHWHKHLDQFQEVARQAAIFAVPGSSVSG